MVGFLISPDKCPECGEMLLFPFTRMVEVSINKYYGLLSMKCDGCGWMTDIKEDLKRFKEYLIDNDFNGFDLPDDYFDNPEYKLETEE